MQLYMPVSAYWKSTKSVSFDFNLNCIDLKCFSLLYIAMLFIIEKQCTFIDQLKIMQGDPK